MSRSVLCPICGKHPRKAWVRETVNGPHTSRPGMARKETRLRATCLRKACVTRWRVLRWQASKGTVGPQGDKGT